MTTIAWLFILHFISDFLLQPRWVAEKKSTDFDILLIHLFAISFVMWLGLIIIGFDAWILFVILNAAIHGVIDWNIWSIYKWTVIKRFPPHPNIDPATYEYWKDSWFYHTIGLDQLLHGLTIIFLYVLLT